MITSQEYISDFNKVLDACLNNQQHQRALSQSINCLRSTKGKNKIILIGNGGSSGIAEHMAIDFTKNAGLKAIAFSGTPMLTTFSNDFGYEQVYAKAIEAFADNNDVLIAISSSGTSKNILNAVSMAKQRGMKIITFSGFDADNPLRATGDINIWVDSKAFGFVEMIHHLLIHYINDAIIGKTEYMIR